eukprot:scaffold28225_cov20-Cyclotella_meneghiniana.AAC.1
METSSVRRLSRVMFEDIITAEVGHKFKLYVLKSAVENEHGWLPLSMNANHANDDDDVIWSPPRWLQRVDDSENYLRRGFHSLTVGENTSSNATIQSSTIEATLQQFLETFESLIQTDLSTLAPFLSTMSLLFDKTNNDPTAIHHDKSSNTQPNSHIHNLYITTRKQCYQLCISSLSSISEHDLPSVITSLFNLVSDGEDCSLAVQAVREEWSNISRAAMASQSTNEDSVLFIGNVIVSFLLSNQTASKNISESFLDEITNSLRVHFESIIYNEGAETDSSSRRGVVSTLDAMVITALYSQHEHQKTIERLLDALVSRRSYLALDCVSPLIRLWRSRSDNNRVSGRVRREESSLLMYEVLATPLVSLLFYLMIATSTSQSVAYLDFVRVGGLFPFCNVDPTTNSVSSDEGSQALSFACCKAFDELHH